MANHQEEIQLRYLYCNKIDMNNLKLGVKKGTRTLFTYNGDPDLYIHLPYFKVPFNLKEKKTKEGKVFMKTISFSTENVDLDDPKQTKTNNKHIKKFVQFVDNVDAIASKKFPNREQYNSLYVNPEGKYAPTFNVNIKFKYGTHEVNLDVFDNQENLLAFDDFIFKNKIVTGILKLDSVWESNGKIGTNWNAVQLQIVKDCPIPEKPKEQSTLNFNIQ